MKLHLRVLSGMQIGDHGHIEPPGGIIGRGDGCALHLRDDSVSRAHMELRYQQDSWWAFQRSARSLSMVDGVPVGNNPLALRERGTLQVGGISVEYQRELHEATDEPTASPATMINVRRQLPSIQHAVLPHMTPMRVAEPRPSEAPATLILRRQPAEPPQAPPTLISRRAPAEPPPIPLTARSPSPKEPTGPDALASVERERDALRLARDQLAAELQKATQANAELRQRLEQQPAVSVSQVPSQLATQALALLEPFSASLERATQALHEGDAANARTLLREASFGLADLRDLFETTSA